MAGKLMESLQTDLSTRLYRVTNGFNESLYLVANEPSLGMYRLQEHVHATVPKVVEQKLALQQVLFLTIANITRPLPVCTLGGRPAEVRADHFRVPMELHSTVHFDLSRDP